MSDSNPAKPESPSPSPPSKSKSYWYVCILLSLLSTFFIISTLQDHANIWQPFSPLQTSIQTSEPNSNDEPIPHLFHDKDFILLRPNPNQTYSWEQITPDTTDKLILLYFSAQETVQTLGARQLAACPEHRCAITTNKAHFNRSAAVVFYGTELSCDLPKPQRAFPRQVFIFAMGESPAHGQPCGFMLRKHFFNWTMTYRLDSDIRAHYTYQVPWEEKRRNFAAGKTKLVAWMVSHCKTSSQREKYVAELAKYIPVDVYGACGNLTCGPRGEREAECLSKIREYKFYISFENSMCRDYVTEKVIHPLEYESVPIVYGDGNYHIFPPNSYIHAYDYYSPARLAEYLHFLDGNDTAYNLHMEWRYNRTLVQSHGPFAAKKNGFCRLCQKLHSPVLSMVSKSYASIESWWSLGDDWRRGPSFNNRVRIKPFLNRESVCRHPYWLFDPMHLNEKDTYKGIKTNWSVQ